MFYRRVILAALLLFLTGQAAAAEPEEKRGIAKPFRFGAEVRMPILLGEPASYNPRVGIGMGVKLAWFYHPNLALAFSIDHDRISPQMRQHTSYLPPGHRPEKAYHCWAVHSRVTTATFSPLRSATLFAKCKDAQQCAVQSSTG